MNTVLRLIVVLVWSVFSAVARGELVGDYSLDTEALRKAFVESSKYADLSPEEQEKSLIVVDRFELSYSLNEEGRYFGTAFFGGDEQESSGTYETEEGELVLTELAINGVDVSTPRNYRLQMAEGRLFLIESGMPIPLVLRKFEVDTSLAGLVLAGGVMSEEEEETEPEEDSGYLEAPLSEEQVAAMVGKYSIDFEELRAAVKQSSEYGTSTVEEQAEMLEKAIESNAELTLNLDGTYTGIESSRGYSKVVTGTYQIGMTELVLTGLTDDGIKLVVPDIVRIKKVDDYFVIDKGGMRYPMVLRKVVSELEAAP